MGCGLLFLWLLSITGFVLGSTVDPGAYNMGAGVGLAALVFTVIWLVDRRG